ncbi:uncharacterized protein LOC126325936 isoform X2 [Schistocerca gregaria]|uniref:uncharacterized protein LOC126325936 isoform X2 n=1 Tax=Schistocerca gregaria TaxID=7010 RepID=UPI00211E28A5|nr:uncharacterized protein LOC126325936 isoform X2 [Schistocerca gregaria]
MALLKKIGLGNHYSDDVQFKELRKEFEESRKILENVSKNLNKFLEKVDELLKTQERLSNEILQDDNNFNTTPELLKLYKSASDLQMRERDALNHHVRTICLDPLNKYKAQYREIQERLHEHKRLGEEVEKLGSEHRNAKKKNSALAAGIERRLGASKQHHGELHEELCQDIHALISDRNKFLEPIMAILFNIQLRFYQGEHQAFLQFANQVPNVQPDVLQNYPRVIRPRKDSVLSKGYAAKAAQTSQPAAAPAVPNAQFGTHYAAYPVAAQVNPQTNMGYSVAAQVNPQTNMGGYPTSGQTNPQTNMGYPTSGQTNPQTNMGYPMAGQMNYPTNTGHPAAGQMNPMNNAQYYTPSPPAYRMQGIWNFDAQDPLAAVIQSW